MATLGMGSFLRCGTASGRWRLWTAGAYSATATWRRLLGDGGARDGLAGALRGDDRPGAGGRVAREAGEEDGVADEVATPEPAGLGREAERPFQAVVLQER